MIEKRQKVVELARTHFCLVEDPLLQIHHTDAADFLAAPCAASYDLVLVDIHDPDGMSSAVGAESFLSLIHISAPTRRYALSYAVFC